MRDIFSYDNRLIAEGMAKGEKRGRAARDMEIAQKAFDGISKGKSLSSVIEMLRELGIPDNVIESAHKL